MTVTLFKTFEFKLNEKNENANASNLFTCHSSNDDQLQF